MADNTTLNPGVGGDVVAADDVDGVKFQRVKVSIGADGEFLHDVSLDHAMPVHSYRKKWRDDFNGVALDTAKWVVVQQGAGQTITLSGGEMAIAMGTTANAETIIRSVDTFTIGFRAWLIGRMSQRIANNEVYFEIVNADGTMSASWKLDATTATNGKYNATNGGNGIISAASTITTTASDSILEIDLSADEAIFASRAVDSTAGKVNVYSRTRNVPDPNDNYYVQIRVKNLGTAPASNTTVTVGAVCVLDINELTAEITGGRGDTTANKAIPVVFGTTQTVIANASPSNSYGLSTGSHYISAASANATLVVGSAVAPGCIIAQNTHATDYRFLKLFNKATAPVPGTDTPVYTLAIPPKGEARIDAPFVGLRFTLGLGFAITAGMADLDTTAIGANEVIVNIARP